MRNFRNPSPCALINVCLQLNCQLSTFDIANHNILLAKSEHYGIRGHALNWFKFYLTDRSQFVTIIGSDSNLMGFNVESHRDQYLALCYFSFISTIYVIFHSTTMKIPTDIVIKTGHKHLKRANYIKFLGILQYEHLSWKYHILNCQKVS